jgi:hypothetical protein
METKPGPTNISQSFQKNIVMMKVEEILKHKELHFLLSDEGVF